MAKAADISKKENPIVSYRYEATTTQGKLVKGTIKASGEIEAERILIERGFHPLTVEETPSMFSLEEALPSLFNVKPRDVIIFSRQLATLLRSGISLLPALEILGGQVSGSRTFKKVLQSVISDIRAGGAFTDALAKHPTAFSELYCRTIVVGEQTGNLETVLQQMADFQEMQGATAQKVKKALSYPMLILGVGLVVVIILMTVVMPQLMGLFTSMGVDLPLPTRILMGVSDFLTSYPLYFLIGGSVIAALALWFAKQSTGRRILDRLLVTIPMMGPANLMAELARFSRTMAVLVNAGLSLQEVMELAPQSTANTFIRDTLNQVNERLLLGEGLSEPMSQIELFPPLLVQMVVVGEETNTLDFTMGVVADFYESASEEKMNSLVGMLGPMTTIGIALLVGFIAISVLMPMYSITGSIG
ncbi:type II secretion system F family protein [Chloroflexota bacterium]